MGVENDVSSNRAPKAPAQVAREEQLQASMDAMVPPAPDVDTEVMPVPRSEMMTELPAESKDIRGWTPKSIK